jgi:hypothetical protein
MTIFFEPREAAKKVVCAVLESIGWEGGDLPENLIESHPKIAVALAQFRIACLKKEDEIIAAQQAYVDTLDNETRKMTEQ